MKRPFKLSKTIAQRGLRRTGLVLFPVLALLAGALFYAFSGQKGAHGLFSSLHPWVIATWAFTLMAIVAVFFLGYLLVWKAAERRESPLFAVGATFLLFVVLARVFWEMPTIRKTLVQAFQDPTGICQVIMGIFVIGLGACLAHFLWLRREYRNFMSICSRMAHLSLESQAELERALSLMEDAQGLFKSKWRNLRENLQLQLDSDYDSLISFPDQREFLKENKVTFIIKILPIMGMVGTVLGFTVAVVGMQEAAGTMSDFSSFKGNLLEALGGMKTAFLTTLVGMVAMLFVMWVNTLIEQARRQILSHEAEFLYMKLFLPMRKIAHKQ